MSNSEIANNMPNNTISPPKQPSQLGQQNPQNRDVIDLLPLFKMVWQKKWSIISIVFAVMLLAVLIVLNIIPTYRATATLLIEQKQSQVVSIEQVYGLDGGSSEYLQTQFELLKSRALAERVVKALNLTTHKEFDPRQQDAPLIDIKSLLSDFSITDLLPGTTPSDMADDKALTEAEILDVVVRQFMKQVTISPLKKSQLVKISVEMHDPVLAALAANKMGEHYIKSQFEAAIEISNTATNWMTERVEELRNVLQQSEDKLQAFKDREQLIDVNGITTVSAKELAAISERLVEARGDLSKAKSQYQQVQSISSDEWQKLASIPAVLKHPLIQTFKAEEARAKAKVEELSKRYGRLHPDMMAAASDLTAARSSLKTQVEQIVAGIASDYQIAKTSVRSLKRSVSDNKAEIRSISRREYQLRAFQREVSSNRVLYETFMNRLKETSATVDLQVTNARVVDPAVTPVEAAKPKKGLIVVISGLLAGMFAVFLTLLLNALNNTFKSIEEIETKLNLPVLGIVPQIKLKAGENASQLYHESTDRMFTESLKTIRTGVILSGIDHSQKIILITSSLPKEGKSTVAINLADALGEMEKVLLIEADMRRPTVAKNLKLPAGTPGLANLIAGTVTVEEATLSLYGGIDTIIAGVVPPNPLELLSSPKFKALIQQLSEKYDRIIIDSAPVHAVSDAFILSQLADGIIYVVRSESTHKPQVVKGVGQLLQHNVPIKGIVLSQVDLEKAKKNSDAYGGYYEYYGSDTDQSKKIS
ncbi:MAG: polysaccharide biosynthesis transport protein [Thiomicrorhabdus sp.]|nr:MAG: polysaccharide biosynthesis transport protein [Thiomicrorhabdus sp.]